MEKQQEQVMTRDPITSLREACTQPWHKHSNKPEVIRQCELFLALLKASDGSASLSQLVNATRKALQTIGISDWHEREMTMFYHILIDSGYVTLNKNLCPEKQDPW